MELNPVIFALLTYGIAIVISFCVAFIIKIIAVIVRRGEKGTPAPSAGKES